MESFDLGEITELLNSSDYEGLVAALGGFFLVVGLILLALIIVTIIAKWKLFKKAGKGGWEAIIPFYSSYVLIEISGLNWWYFLVFYAGTFLDLINVDLGIVGTLGKWFVYSMCFYNISKKMHKNEIAGSILGTIFNDIMIMVYGFSKTPFDKDVKVGKNGYIG